FGTAGHSIRVAIATIAVLISLIGGRIIPSFTHNWLARHNPGRLPVSFGRFDVIVVALSAITFAAWTVEPGGSAIATMLAAAGLLHLVRLGRWAGDRTTGEPLVLVLHVGYAFVPIGFLLAAFGAIGSIPPSAGIHAWMAGAAGMMTLAVMTRASLGHTGRPLTASVSILAIYVAGLIAAVSRIVAVLDPAHGEFLLHLAAVTWAAAFFGFALVLGPILAGSQSALSAR